MSNDFTMDDLVEQTETEGASPSGQADYFASAFRPNEFHYLPDGVSYVEIKFFSEGDRTRYQDKTRGGMKLKKGGDAEIAIHPGQERNALLTSAIVGWNLVRAGRPFPFTPGNLRTFLEVADPRVVDDIEKAVRVANPWLLGDVSLEDLEKEYVALGELIEAKRNEEAGKGL